MSSGDEETSEEGKQHNKQFTEWRKKHYNEFYAVKRAKELMQQVTNPCLCSVRHYTLYRTRRN